MQDLLPVTNVLGRLLMFFSLAYVLPIGCSLIFHDGTAIRFFDAMLITLGAGVILTFGTRRHVRELKNRDGFLLVTLSWTLMAAIGAVPLMLVYENMSFTNAFFETISAMTTTGATIMTGLDNAPQAINLWRHQLQWLGGMGIIVLAVAILPLLGVGGMQLFRAEMSGALKESRLTARIADTAKLLWFVYLGMTIAAIAALRLAGMSWFDAVCHSFSAVALGGFSTRDSSIGAFNSPEIEGVLAVIMIIAGINFALHFTALRARDYRPYLRDAEASVYLWILGASVLAVAGYLYSQGTYPHFLTALRHAFFNVVSIGTGSGYASVDYSLWPLFAPMLMLFLPNILPCAGSTGGGIKLVRALILYKQARRELNKLLHPNIADLIKLGGFIVPNKVAFSVLGFIFLYFMTTVTMTFVLLLTGADFLSAFSAVVACITNLGPALGIAGPASNYGAFTDFQKWVLASTMLLGRLEIMSVVVIFTRPFWRK